ncbi:MAG: fimbrillin family protein [Candidatus Cryptobacteroides sp.]
MNRIWNIALVPACLLLAACRKDNPQQPQTAVRWSVEGVEGYSGSKALINNASDIAAACTPGTGNQTIGIWADYDITIDGTPYSVENVFKGTRLIYNPLSSATDTKWEYEGDPAYWVAGGKYIFRAYYPSGEVSVLESSSSAKAFVVESNTVSTQRDLLLAFNSFDTATGLYADGTSGDMSKPVPFFFRHAMAAMKVRFRFEEGFFSSDSITSCWFETTASDAFALTGMMSYGDGVTLNEGKIKWITAYCPSPGTQFYLWKHPAGVPFSHPGAGNHEIATAYSIFSAGDTGEKFTGQDGFVLIIPQTSSGRLEICFTTSNGGNTVFKIAVPRITGTSNDKYLANPDDPSTHKDPTGCDYIPGWRYTYTIVITKTDAQIVLGIAPWNKLDSSFDISF